MWVKVRGKDIGLLGGLVVLDVVGEVIGFVLTEETR